MELFGRLASGEEIYKFTLRSGASMAEVITLGASLRSFKPYGKEILGGFSTLEEYASGTFFGASVGRVCNRIVGGSILIDGTRYELSKNNGEHCLHGGEDRFNTKAWDVISYTDSSVKLGYTSPNGQSGFPGEVKVTAEFRLVGADLSVEYRGVPDKKTPIMITSHGFFNLEGFDHDVLSHVVRIYADECTEVDSSRLPTGIRAPVAETFLDFRMPRTLGERIDESPVGYDHNYILSPTSFIESNGRSLGLAAEVSAGNLKLSAYTDQPGMQLYVMMTPPKKTPIDKTGAAYIRHGAFCLESQIEPNCVSRGIGLIDAGEEYVSTTLYKVERI